MNWTDNLKSLAALIGDASYEDDADFLAVLPAAITAAENRILRDLDLLSTRVTDDTAACTANRRTFILPTGTGTFIVLEELRAIVDGVYGQPLLPMSRESLNMMFPSEIAPSIPSVPLYWAPLDQASVLVAPAPDQNYPMQCFGTMRPATLNAQSADGTFISTQLADVFLAAEMAWLYGGWMKKAGAQSDDPTTASFWEAEYTRLKDGAGVEEFRRKLQANGWSVRKPSPLATPRQT